MTTVDRARPVRSAMGALQSPFRPDRIERQSSPVMPGGVEGGLVAGVAVALAMLIRDWSLGEPLHTPSVLGTLLLQGVDAARTVRAEPGVAAVYNALHFAGWIFAAFIASILVHRVARGESGWALPGLAFLALIGTYVGLDLWIAETSLGRSQLWIGGLVGAVALAAYLGWRYPPAVARLLRRTDGPDAS
jgi:uncharacterized MAPEG superfamily protein